MSPASRGHYSLSASKSVATRIAAERGSVVRPAPTRAERLAKVADGVRVRVADMRAALITNAPHGFQSRVADLMAWRKERPTREVSGVEKLSVDLVLAEAALHEEEGRPDSATRVLASFQRKVTPVIRMTGDGQFLLELE